MRQIDAVQTADDVGVLNPGAAGALATAQDLRHQLDEALAPSTVDSDRLRVSGLLGHSLPVIASPERASQESGLNTAQGHLNRAWAEANEALSEIRPIAPSRPLAQPAPAVLPSACNLDGPTLATPPFIAGPVLLIVGILLRRGTPPVGRLSAL